MNYGVIATGNQYIFIRCAERHPFRQGQGAKKDHPLLSGGQPPTAVRRAANQNSLIASGNHTIVHYGSALTPIGVAFIVRNSTILVNIHW